MVLYRSSRTMTSPAGMVIFVVVVSVQLIFCLSAAFAVNWYYVRQIAISCNWLAEAPKPREGYLPGWPSDKPGIPCFGDELKMNWLGVECLRLPMDRLTNGSTTEDYEILVVGLTLREASISGTLPAPIGDLAPLLFLTLTGNPKLKGNIPDTLAKLQDSLITLDLHDNALYGPIPDAISSLINLQTLDLSNNTLTGTFPDLTKSSMLQTLDLSSNRLGGNISTDAFDNLTNLVTMDLSNNKFSGPIPRLSGTYFQGLTMIKYINLSRNEFVVESLSILSKQIFNQGSWLYPNESSVLRVLDLSHNNISGDVNDLGLMMSQIGSQMQEVYLDFNNITGTLSLDYDFLSINLTAFGNYSRLRILSLANNAITKVIYNWDYIGHTNILSKIRLDGNPFCNSPEDDYAIRCFCHHDCAMNVELVKKDAVKIALGISVPSVLLVVLVAALLYHRSTRQHKYSLLEMHRRCEELDVKPTIFTYKELETATRNFHPSMKLGEGSYGAVYKGELSKSNIATVGELSQSNIVAVKQLTHANSQQGMDEFLNEVALISGMKHRNLVKLKGCCIRDKQRLLVYEYVDNHDLEWNLLEGKSKEIMSWPTRLGICLGVAHGLHCLHSLAQPKVIHRDTKAANILLDKKFEPKIADFGLALLFPEETTHIMTVHVAGTKGYLAPEYATLGQLSEKADVYSFGVVCLEIVSGRRNVDNKMAPEQVVLTSWALKLHREGRAIDILDSRLDSLSENELVEVNRVILTALLCLQYSEALRPPMASVVSMLQRGLFTDIGDIETADTTLGKDDSGTFEIPQPGLETIMEDHSIRFFEGQSSLEL